MKKSEKYDFSRPTRQSYAAILIIMYRLYMLIVKQLFPIFIIVLIQGKIGKSQWFIYFIIGVAALGAVYSILSFFKYFFFLKEDKLVVKKGVFKKSILEIPFDRIQSINTEQNLIHRIFRVVKLNMDTAGSASNEMQLHALDNSIAQQLTERILKGKRETSNNSLSDDVLDFEGEKKVVFQLSFFQLLKVGITENHLRSGGLLIFFFFYIIDSLEDYGVEFLDKSEQYLPAAQELVQSLIIVLVLLFLFGVVSFVISLVRTFLKFYNLHMYRKGDGFVIESGLLNKKERAAKDEKIQLVRWSQNLLQKVSGIFELTMKQASSEAVGEIKSFKVVGLSRKDVDLTQEFIFKDKLEELLSLPMNSVNRYFLLRRILLWSYLFIPLISLTVLLSNLEFIIYLSLLYSIALLGSLLSYKKKKYGVGENILRVDGGVFGNKSTSMPLFKVQNITLTETPFQRRRKLSTVIIYTASGAIKIPEIYNSIAVEIQNYLLFKVEKSKTKWM